MMFMMNFATKVNKSDSTCKEKSLKMEGENPIWHKTQ